jgi:glycolate oxidase iron-sulfur subunit
MKAISDGRQTLSAETARHFDLCLGCLACVSACPSGVDYETLIDQTRVEVEATVKRPFGERLMRAAIFAVLPFPWRLRLLAVLQWLAQRLGLRFLLRRSGATRLLPAKLRALESLAPSVHLSDLVRSLPALSSPRATPRARVALLSGCVQSVYFQSVNRATLRVLTAEGCEVVVPNGLGCCGALSGHAGRRQEAQAFARKAIAALELAHADAIVVNAAGCGASMKHWGRLFEDDLTWKSRAEAIADKVRDVSCLLVELGPLAERKPLPLVVAYHDACHLSHGQGVTREPRALLRAVPGLELREIPDGNQCCGSAGVYNLLESASAEAIGQRKADNVLSVGAQVLVSANPGCSLQIERHLGAAGRHLRVAHPIELLDASIQGRPGL